MIRLPLLSSGISRPEIATAAGDQLFRPAPKNVCNASPETMLEYARQIVRAANGWVHFVELLERVKNDPNINLVHTTSECEKRKLYHLENKACLRCEINRILNWAADA